MSSYRKQNILSIWIAWIVAISLFTILWSNLSWSLNSLQSNIVGAKQNQALGEFIQESYEKSVRLSANIAMTDIQSISLFVMYDLDELSPLFDDIDTDANYVYTKDSSGMVTIILTQVPNLEIWSELLKLQVDGDPSMLVFSDMSVVFQDQEKSSVSISVQ